MNKLLLLLFALVSLAACKKEGDVTPGKPTVLADKFAGTYTLNSFRYSDTENGANLNFPALPATNAGTTVSGTVRLVKKTDKTVDMNFLMKTTGANDFDFTVNDLEIKQSGSEYGLYLDGTRIADVEGTTIIFNYSENDPTTKARQEMAFIAKR